MLSLVLVFSALAAEIRVNPLPQESATASIRRPAEISTDQAVQRLREAVLRAVPASERRNRVAPRPAALSAPPRAMSRRTSS